jgi:REP element-mobilizing transposase RayT
MANSYAKIYVHYVFSTKERRHLIGPDIRDRLWAYMGGIAREHKVIPMQIGGEIDHAHLLLGMSSILSVAKTVQLIKGGSSKWFHETFPTIPFAWQEGYGAFSIGRTELKAVTTYIHGQSEHHKTQTFKEEYLRLLDLYGEEYDIRYVFD